MVWFREATWASAAGAHPLAVEVPAPRCFYRDADLVVGFVAVVNPYFEFTLWGEDPPEPPHFSLAVPNGWLGGAALTTGPGTPAAPPGQQYCSTQFYCHPVAWAPGKGDHADSAAFTVDVGYFAAWHTALPLQVVVCLASYADVFREIVRAPYNSLPGGGAIECFDPIATAHPARWQPTYPPGTPGYEGQALGVGDLLLCFAAAMPDCAWAWPAGFRERVDARPGTIRLALADQDTTEPYPEQADATSSPSAYAVTWGLTLQQQPHCDTGSARDRMAGRLYHARTGNHWLPDRLQRGMPGHDINPLWFKAHADETAEASIRPHLVRTGPGVQTGEALLSDAPVHGAGLLAMQDGRLYAIYCHWRTVEMRTSRDAGATWSDPVTIGEGYDDVAAGCDPVTGRLLAMLYLVEDAGAVTGSWYLSVGAFSGGSIAWTPPRLAVANAKPGGASLCRRSDGAWQFACTVQRGGAWPWYTDPALLTCKKLLADGSGSWE